MQQTTIELSCLDHLQYVALYNREVNLTGSSISIGSYVSQLLQVLGTQYLYIILQ